MLNVLFIQFPPSFLIVVRGRKFKGETQKPIGAGIVWCLSGRSRFFLPPLNMFAIF